MDTLFLKTQTSARTRKYRPGHTQPQWQHPPPAPTPFVHSQVKPNSSLWRFYTDVDPVIIHHHRLGVVRRTGLLRERSPLPLVRAAAQRLRRRVAEQPQPSDYCT